VVGGPQKSLEAVPLVDTAAAETVIMLPVLVVGVRPFN
jgi:hypothetical protein